MREHPIPQDVVGYRFHIVGNMTIKQFAELGAGCILAFIIYSTNLFAFLKWPLIGLSVATGALAAFVPFEERPLDHWIITFVRVLYKPTQFYWRREPKIPEAFLFKSSQAEPTQFEVDLSPARRQRIQEFLKSLNGEPQLDEFDSYEQQRMAGILAQFQTVQVQQVSSTQQAHRPSLTVRPRSLKPQESDAVEETVLAIPELGLPQPAPEPDVVDQNYLNAKQQLEATQVGTEVQIPETPYLSVDTAAQEAATTTQAVAEEPDQVFSTEVASSPIDLSLQQAATLNQDLPFPTKPTEPNKLVGMVLTPRNELVNDAIIEIRTEQGSVARAVKTNALGQFFITTPLANGTYFMQAEKDGFSFTPQQITLTGVIVDPIEIRSLV